MNEKGLYEEIKWKIKKDDTESFLLKWKNEAPRVIFQYATEKMTKEEKQKFRKEKKKEIISYYN